MFPFSARTTASSSPFSYSAGLSVSGGIQLTSKIIPMMNSLRIALSSGRNDAAITLT